MMPAPTSAELRNYSPAEQLLADRVILVTGASGSIGGALAQACARLGARVILSGRSVRKLEKVYDSIVAQGGPRPSIAPIDFEKADAAAYDALAEAIGAEFGRLDGLAHVGAILGDRSPIAHYDVPTWLRVMHVNVNAPFILTKLLLPLLRSFHRLWLQCLTPFSCSAWSKLSSDWLPHAATMNPSASMVITMSTESPVRRCWSRFCELSAAAAAISFPTDLTTATVSIPKLSRVS